jgi:hypothetical protein
MRGYFSVRATVIDRRFFFIIHLLLRHTPETIALSFSGTMPRETT